MLSRILVGTGMTLLFDASIAIGIGLIMQIIINGITSRKLVKTLFRIVVIILSCTLLIYTLFFGFLAWPLVAVHDFFSIQHKIGFQLLDSFTIDTSRVMEYYREKTKLADKDQITGFVHGFSHSNMELRRILVTLDLSDEIIIDISQCNISDLGMRMVLTFGREMKEFKYKMYGGSYVSQEEEAIIVLGEEYKENTMYIYILDEVVQYRYFNFYIRDGKKLRRAYIQYY